jgi:predicted alpha/beta-fold hydrolase
MVFRWIFEDLELAINHLIKRDPSAVIFGVGFSIGANVLLKYAGYYGKNCPLVGIVSISNPYDVLGAVRSLQRSFIGRKLYLTTFGQRFKQLLYKYAHVFVDLDWLDMQELSKVKGC